MKAVSQLSLDFANLESLGTRILNVFDNQFVGNELERTSKINEFLDQIRDYVISASGIQPQDAFIASINAHA